MAFSSVLSIVQSYCREYAIPVPNVLTGSTDAGALQMRELCQTVGEYIWSATDWQQCSRRVVFAANGLANLGNIYTLCPENMASIVPRTFWNNSLRREMYGPVNDLNWQSQLSLAPPGPLYYFRISNNNLETSAVVPLNHSLSLIYKSFNWVLAGTTPKQFYTLDTDTSVFSDQLVKAGLRAHWLRAKQMPHKYEFERFEMLVLQEASQNTVRPILSTDGESTTHRPGILVPIGNWTVGP